MLYSNVPALVAFTSIIPVGAPHAGWVIVGADMGFVVAHHLLRIFFVILGAPVMARLFAPKQKG